MSSQAPKGGEMRYRAFYGQIWVLVLQRLGLPHAGCTYCVTPQRLE